MNSPWKYAWSCQQCQGELQETKALYAFCKSVKKTHHWKVQRITALKTFSFSFSHYPDDILRWQSLSIFEDRYFSGQKLPRENAWNTTWQTFHFIRILYCFCQIYNVWYVHSPSYDFVLDSYLKCCSSSSSLSGPVIWPLSTSIYLSRSCWSWCCLHNYFWVVALLKRWSCSVMIRIDFQFPTQLLSHI